LITPHLIGSALRADIQSTKAQAGTIYCWWLGQSGYVLKSSSGTLIIDPYLSESLTAKYAATDKPHTRMTACPISGGEVPDVDVILSSHKHTDHMDRATLEPMMDANRTANLALPESLLDHAASLGLPSERLIGLVEGQMIEKAGFRVRAIPSAHEALDTDEVGRHLYLGFVIEVDGLRLYHSGDSLAYDGLADHLGHSPFDVLFLPINGRDARRGVAGNMSCAEAVDLAIRVQPRFVVPHHYDMFTFNTVPISDFEAEAERLPEGVAPVILQCGQRWELRP
jgi:L-ascorbate metabolism protein UlaG (beta-lactamase superfamily)